MSKNDIKKIAADFVKANPNAGGCYVTKDGSVFYRNYEGLQYARGHAGNPKEVHEFDENGELITPVNAAEERETLITKIANDDRNKYRTEQLTNLSNEGLRKLAGDIEVDLSQTDDSGDDNDNDEIDIDKANKDQLKELLLSLDPNQSIAARATKDQLKEAIIAANSLDGYDDAALLGLIRAFDPDTIAEDTPDEDVFKALDTNELKQVVLKVRDEVELDQEIADKLFALGSEGVENDTNENEGGDDTGDDSQTS